MNRGILLIALFFAVGVALYHYLAPQPVVSAYDPTQPARTVDLSIERRVSDPHQVAVPKGTPLTLNIRTDEAGALHVEGYEETVSIAPGRAAAISFTTGQTGTFPIHMHPASDPDSEIPVGMLVVN